MTAQYAKEINHYILNKDVDALMDYLSSLNDTVTFDTDLFYTFYMANVYKTEKENNETGLFDYYSDISDILKALKSLRRMVRRLEWCGECDKNEILIYMNQNHLSAYILYWVIESCCVDSNKVWGIVRDE